jgi:glycosyltransferase involved in cell wall biosynthesis
MSPSITVITLTRNRPEQLRRAIESVRNQVCSHPVQHLVLVDACERTVQALESWTGLPGNLEWLAMERSPGDCSGPGRSSRLRNFGVRRAESDWIAFLDDDNEWEPDHLEGLITCALQTGVRAVHSHLQIFHADGTPYREPLSPWGRDPEEARAKYQEMVRLGVYTPGSNVFKDRADPLGHPDPVRSVDTGEWLLARPLLLEVPFRDQFTAEDGLNLTGEDDKLLSDLIARGEPIACNGRATLRYYLGGYSNNPGARLDASFAWA